jgi:DNA-binding MarR family transcriptional regulator
MRAQAYNHTSLAQDPPPKTVQERSNEHDRLGGMADVPLSAAEDLVWRNLMRLVFTLRPGLDEDLQRTCGLTSTEYSVLMHVSESPDRQLRMSELADRTSLSPSRISRVIDAMARAGLVERRSSAEDGRNTYAGLTRLGLATLRRAWPHHLRSVRTRAFDHLTPEEIHTLGPLLERLAEAGDSLRASRLERPGVSLG